MSLFLELVAIWRKMNHMAIVNPGHYVIVVYINTISPLVQGRSVDMYSCHEAIKEGGDGVCKRKRCMAHENKSAL